MSVPYVAANAAGARAEITRILKGFGCESIGFMDDFSDHSVLLAFRHRGRAVQLRASAAGWANLYLKSPPNKKSHARRLSRDAALEQGQKAVNSILRDWIKGQVTAVECGILSFESVFLPYMLASDGRPLIEHLQASGALPAPSGET